MRCFVFLAVRYRCRLLVAGGQRPRLQAPRVFFFLAPSSWVLLGLRDVLGANPANACSAWTSTARFWGPVNDAAGRPGRPFIAVSAALWDTCPAPKTARNAVLSLSRTVCPVLLCSLNGCGGQCVLCFVRVFCMDVGRATAALLVRFGAPPEHCAWGSRSMGARFKLKVFAAEVT